MMEGTYCFCLESTLAQVTPQLKRGKRCAKCRPYACNSIHHPENMTKAVRERLRAAPYFRLGKRHERFIAKKARDAKIAYLKAVWAREDAAAAAGAKHDSEGAT